MALHSLVVFLLLVGPLCCMSQANASTLRVVFDLQEDVSYRLAAGSDPTLIRIIFPTLRFPPKLRVARARTGPIQERFSFARWRAISVQV